MAETLKYGDITPAVGTMQESLIQRGFMTRLNPKGRPNRDNWWGTITTAALLKFQLEMVRLGLLNQDEATGRTCGPRCMSLLQGSSMPMPTETPDWPERPPFDALGSAGTKAIFGEFDYRPKRAKTSGGDEIEITDRWADENIVTVRIPQLIGVPLYYPGNTEKCSGKVTLHRLAVPVFKRFFEAAEEHGLLPLIKTYDGAYNPRFQRGSYTSLSNHAFGTAMDLNAYANGMGKTPAPMGHDGCLLPLVEVASNAGLYWGGFFSGSRRDGMHFEVARL